MCDAMWPGDQMLIRDVLARVVDRWSLWALSELAKDGPLRFSWLLERLNGVTPKSLTATLRGLERDGFITRTVAVQGPIRVDYEATSLGHALIEQVHPLWLWGAKNLAAFTRARATYDRLGVPKLT
jgi:DNA-binding HxlR family transcriptional regulator